MVLKHRLAILLSMQYNHSRALCRFCSWTPHNGNVANPRTYQRTVVRLNKTTPHYWTLKGFLAKVEQLGQVELREDPVATTTAWPRPWIEDGKSKLSEAWGASPANPRAALTRAGTPPGGGALPKGNPGHEPQVRTNAPREQVGRSPLL